MLQAAISGPELRDIHVPAPPSWWPPAPGWWLLAALAVALCVFLFLYFRKRLRQRRRYRAVMAEFERTVETASADTPALAAALSAFLRRLAMRGVPSAAAFSGDAWLAHLDTTLGGDEFSKGVGRALVEAPYRTHAEVDKPALIALARRTAQKFCEGEAAYV